MAASRRSPPADPSGVGDRPLRDAVARALGLAGASGGPVAVALSGGRDSVALLDATLAVAPDLRVAPVACHVHHGLSPHADRWSAFCAKLCAVRGVAFAQERVTIPRQPGRSLEESAREARYGAIAALAHAWGASVVLLAHHADDQAETLLLQLLRGAGPRGLAGMPAAHTAHGLTWLRPWLDVPRDAIERYVAAHTLSYVEDESNADARFRRNALRVHVVPALRQLSPGYPATVARAAAHQGEAAQLLHELAALDAERFYDGRTLARDALVELPLHRAGNVLRWFLHVHGLRPPSTARLAAMLAQLGTARPDARVRIVHAGAQIGLARGRIAVHPPPPPPFDCAWDGAALLHLPHGTLALVADDRGDLDRDRLFASPVHVRARRGGERFRTGAGRPRRSLKHILQEAPVAPWEREALPLVYAGEVLAAVPGVGVDPDFSPAGTAPRYRLQWQPAGVDRA